MTQEELDALMSSGNYEAELSKMEGATCDITKAPDATKENRVVYQLDEVALDAEKKAAEVFDKLDLILNKISNLESAIENNKPKSEQLNEIASIKSEIFETTSIMQFHDIHRQKIERVIDVMRNLSHYMGQLLEGKIDDSNRGQIAKHISGDNQEVVDSNELDDLINSFNK